MTSYAFTEKKLPPCIITTLVELKIISCIALAIPKSLQFIQILKGFLKQNATL
jgi:hypothetical protein